MDNPREARPGALGMLEIPDLDVVTEAPAPRGTPVIPARQSFRDVEEEGLGLGKQNQYELEPLASPPRSWDAECHGQSSASGRLAGVEDELDWSASGGSLDLRSLEPPPRRSAGEAHETGLTLGQTPTPADLRIHAAAIATAAGYGEPPSAWWLAPVYAIRVHWRQRRLREVIRKLGYQLAQAEQQRDEWLAKMLRDGAAKLANDGRYQQLILQAREVEKVADQHTAELLRARAESSERVDQLGQERNALAAELDRQERLRHQQRLAVEQENHAWERSRARLQRIQIEIRNARAAAAQAGVSEAQGDLTTLRQQETELAEEASVRQREYQAAAARVAALDRQIERLRCQLRSVEQRQTGIGRDANRVLERLGRSAEEAQALRRRAWADAARDLFVSGPVGGFDEPAVSAAKDHDQAVYQVACELEKHVRARDAYHRRTLSRGHRVLATILAMATVSWLLIRLR